MSIIYVVIKGARDPGGEVQMATAERAFTSETEAEKYVKDAGVMWEEVVPVNLNGVTMNYNCYCQRMIHPVELT